MQYWLRITLALALMALISYSMFAFPLHEGYKAVVTHFGKPTRTVEDAGLHIKWPWPIDKVYMLDCRKRVYNTKFTQTLTKDKRSIILLTYVVWQIENPLVFLQSVGNIKNCEDKMEGLVSSAKNNVLGNYELSNLVSTNPEQLRFGEIEKNIKEAIENTASKSFGVKILNLGIKRLAYPENNVIAIFNQMNAERAQYAAKYRAEGREKASMILSETDLEIAKISAEAVRKATEIKGEADKKAAEIYANANKQSAEFYKFSRSLEALETIVNNNAVFLLRSDQPPFNLLTGE